MLFVSKFMIFGLPNSIQGHNCLDVMKYIAAFITILLTCEVRAQEQGVLTGQLQTFANIFLEDRTIGASNTPQYDHQIVGNDLWLDLRYQLQGFDLGVRIDMFNNSNLLNPRDSYSDQGLGKWYVRKQLQKLHFQVGYIYEQVGSGLLFRAYEERPLLIDNALIGASVQYDISDFWSIRALAGRQKNLFDSYGSYIKVVEVEGYVELGSNGGISIAPGLGLLNKTFSDEQIEQLINTVRTYTPQDSLGLFYNSYGATLYNTFSVGSFSWYLEGIYKTRDIYFDADASRLLYSGEQTLGRFRNDDGSTIYTTLAYGAKGLGISLEYRRVKNLVSRADPFVALNRGLVNYLPSMSKVHSFRLKSRYTPATRELSEQAFQFELRYSPKKKWQVIHYLSYITDLNGLPLYREIDNQVTYKMSRQGYFSFGAQSIYYSQAIYEGKSGVPIVRTLTPYVEWFKRVDRRKSIKVEGQYMFTEQDFGSWLFLLAEFNLAPKWSIGISDMYNSVPKKTEVTHYPRLDVSYINNASRFSLSYIKQVEGVVCAGGICRLEPAFSGFRFSITSTF